MFDIPSPPVAFRYIVAEGRDICDQFFRDGENFCWKIMKAK